MGSPSSSRRARVERGIYMQPNGKYAVCCRHAGKLRFRTVGFDLAVARRERAALIALRREGRSAKTAASALATLHSIMRYARRNDWITVDPVDQLESDERPRPARRCQRVLGRGEIERLLAACSPRDRLMIATASIPACASRRCSG